VLNFLPIIVHYKMTIICNLRNLIIILIIFSFHHIVMSPNAPEISKEENEMLIGKFKLLTKKCVIIFYSLTFLRLLIMIQYLCYLIYSLIFMDFSCIYYNEQLINSI